MESGGLVATHARRRVASSNASWLDGAAGSRAARTIPRHPTSSTAPPTAGGASRASSVRPRIARTARWPRAHRREQRNMTRGGGEGARAAGARRARSAPATTARGVSRVGPPREDTSGAPQLPADISPRSAPAVPVLHARGGHRPDGEGRAVEHRRGGARREALRGDAWDKIRLTGGEPTVRPDPRNHPQTRGYPG